ncbi:MAG TPA: hypothetical protein VFS21_39265 [Roseiflexaceae bacterium]|nr:hypothetical protein [Roseiflexaceae bacterium]
MTQSDFEQLVAQIRQSPGLAEQFPDQEASVLRGALGGQDLYQLAQRHRMSEDAVWKLLSSAAQLASGGPRQQIEIGGGLGSDFGAGDEGP